MKKIEVFAWAAEKTTLLKTLVVRLPYAVFKSVFFLPCLFSVCRYALFVNGSGVKPELKGNARKCLTCF